MLNFLKDKNIVKSNKALGVHCVMQQDGSTLFYYILIARNKGKVEIDSYGLLEGGLDQLASQVLLTTPVFLSADGKGVLTKKIIADPLKLPIQQVIPNATEEEFLMQQSNGSDHDLFISITRKDSIDELLKNLIQHKFQVIGLSIGPFKAAELLTIFDELPSDLNVGNCMISFDKEKGEIIDFKRLDCSVPADNYTIDGNIIPSDYLLPFYHALTYYITDNHKLEYSVVTDQHDEYVSKRLFVFSGWTALIILLSLLLINMFLYTNYSDKKKNLETRVAGDKELLGNLKKMNEELIWKEKFLGQAGILKNIRMSYYADRIAMSVPEEITLEKMEIHPIVSKVKKEKEIQVQPDKIDIDGFAGKSEALNDWIKDLKGFSWIEDVSVLNFSKDGNSSIGIFSIELKIVKNKAL